MARTPIPRSLSLRVLYESARTCCVCRNPSRPVQIHHIDKNPTNNVEDNLVVICSFCHGEAHTKHELSQNLSGDKIKEFKHRWVDEVRERASRAMLPSSNLDQAVWTYINHQRLSQFLEKAGCKFRQELIDPLKSKGFVDSFGMPQPIVQPSDWKHTWTVYDGLPYYASHRAHHLLTTAVDDLITAVCPIDLDAIWGKRSIKSLIRSGSICYCLRAFYFKDEQHYPDQKYADRIAYAQARGIKVQLRISTRNMFGDSAIHDSFSGHRIAAALFAVKSITQEEDKLMIFGTPLALGAGFVKYGRNSPYHNDSGLGYDGADVIPEAPPIKD